ncbi:MAG: 4-hydroxybutyrate--acetyl-CoA CoA transferase [Desulfovibrio sp.]|jgi:4-hydroxybutyrate CoA-transferase|nr:4-hydroxybutyrate--acetyl-CoA CoA transferase [Desulfovibrio sp.]
MIPFAAGQPKSTMDALGRRIRELDGIGIAQLVTITKELPYLDEGAVEKVDFTTSYCGARTRDHVNKGTGAFAPVFLKDFPRMYSTEYDPTVALVQVSPPDKHGYVSLGVAVDQNKASAEHAKVVIAEVNPQMPRCHGDCFLHVSQLTHIVEYDHPMLEIPRPVITDVERSIGEHVASLVRDGDCLQLGIGSIPDAAVLFLKDKKHLGIHTEMFSDSVVDLVESGAIDNSAKTLHKGKMVSAFLMGTRRLYDFVDDNPTVWMFPCDYTNDPFVISRNDNMVSVNSSVEVDLMGQAASDTIGPRQYSGVGGQIDFIRGALASRNGRAILALPSTTGKNNEISKIVPRLAAGTPVTTTRNDVDYVVTEYGVASLRFKTLRQRAEQLINIAHPDFREELRAAMRKMNF